MPDWVDNFNRSGADLGADWVATEGSLYTQGQYAKGGEGSAARRAAATGAGAHDVSLLLEDAGNDTGKVFACVKMAADGLSFYCSQLGLVDNVPTAKIYRRSSGSYTELVAQSIAALPDTACTIRLKYDGGALSFWLDGTLVASTSDSALDGNTYVGFSIRFINCGVDTFTDTAPTPPSLTITPSEVYVANPASYLSVTLNNAEWSGPFPAEGVLSVDHGWLITQYRETSTLASFSYQAMGYIGVVTVTDAETGATGTFTTRPYPVSEGDTGFPLDEGGAGIINRTGESCDEGTILTTCTPIDEEGTVNIPTGVDAVLEQLSGYFGQVGADIGTDGRPANVHVPWKKGALSEWYTIDDVLSLLGGTPTLYSHAEIRTDLSNAITVSQTAITDALAALSVGPDGDLFKILQQLAYLRTVEGYTLGTVKAWIDAIAPTDLTDVLDKLDAIQPDVGDTLSTLAAALASVNTIVSGISTSLSAYRTGNDYTVQSILDRLDDIEAKIDALPASGAPVWPGAGSVTLGTPVAYSDNLSIVAPMDGVIVAWTSPPSKTGHYVLGNEHYYYGSGRIAFGTDSGDLEPPQWLGFTSAIYTPQNMQRASAVRFQGVGGAVGTVTPWTRS